MYLFDPLIESLCWVVIVAIIIITMLLFFSLDLVSLHCFLVVNQCQFRGLMVLLLLVNSWLQEVWSNLCGLELAVEFLNVCSKLRDFLNCLFISVHELVVAINVIFLHAQGLRFMVLSGRVTPYRCQTVSFLRDSNNLLVEVVKSHVIFELADNLSSFFLLGAFWRNLRNYLFFLIKGFV